MLDFKSYWSWRALLGMESRLLDVFPEQPMRLQGHAVATNGHWMVAMPEAMAYVREDVPETKSESMARYLFGPLNLVRLVPEDYLLRWAAPRIAPCDGIVHTPPELRGPQPLILPDDNPFCPLCLNTRMAPAAGSLLIEDLGFNGAYLSLVLDALCTRGSGLPVAIERGTGNPQTQPNNCHVRFRFSSGAIAVLMPELEPKGVGSLEEWLAKDGGDR